MRTKDLAILILIPIIVFILLILASLADQNNSDRRLLECKQKHGMAEIDNRGYVRACIIQY